jgi:Single Cache domain 2
MRFGLIISASIACFSHSAMAQQSQFGTAAEAKAMLEKTIVAIKADKAGTIAAINNKDPKFLDRDIYPACSGPDGKVVAFPDPARLGLDRNTMKDTTGKAYGPEILKAEEGNISEVSYMFPRPGTDKTPVQKLSYVTKIGDLVCLVGYYK